MKFFIKMEHFTTQGSTKDERYRDFLKQWTALIEGEEDGISLLANTAAALKEAFGWWWIGFYRVKKDKLILGPFQGPVACSSIAHGRGVCGTAWAEAKTIVVPDVHQFPGHIACSALSASEIVVPIFKDGKVWGVLDVDSDKLNDFDEADRMGLEEVCAVLGKLSLI